MLQPRRTKYRKVQKGRNRGLAYAGNKVEQGQFGLKAIDRGALTSREIEAARRAISRCMNRQGDLFIRVFPTSLLPRRHSVSVRVRVREMLNTG